MLLYQIVADLMPFVAAFYLLECLSWTRPPGVLVSESLGGGFRCHRSSLGLGPVLPWKRAYTAADLPYLLDVDGLWVPLSRDLVPGRLFERANFVRLRWGEVEEVRVDHRRLEVGPATIPFPAPAHAVAHALRLEALRRLDEERRARRLEEETERALRLGAASEREGRVREMRRPLDLACSALFLVTFFAVPATVVIGPLAPALPWLLIVVFLGLVLVGWLVIRTARRLESAGLRTDGLLLPLVLSPPSLIRAPIELTEHLLQGIEGVTVAVLLLDREAALAALRRHHHAARYAADDGATADAPAEDAPAWTAAWDHRARLLERLAGQAGIEPDEITQPPATAEGAGAYCPQCDGTFEREQLCPTCAMPTLAVPAVGRSR